MFPLLDATSIKGLTGGWWALVLGLVTALWSGMSVVRTLQTAFDAVWGIPRDKRPGLVKQVLRSLLVLATVGAGLVVTTLISGLITSSSSGVDSASGDGSVATRSRRCSTWDCSSPPSGC